MLGYPVRLLGRGAILQIEDCLGCAFKVGILSWLQVSHNAQTQAYAYAPYTTAEQPLHDDDSFATASATTLTFGVYVTLGVQSPPERIDRDDGQRGAVCLSLPAILGR